MADEPTTPKDWREELPFELKTHNSIGKFKDIPSLAKSYVELESMMGKRISLPDDKAKEEDWNNYYKHWGRPDKFEEYKLPDAVPKDMVIDEGFINSVRNMSHKLGLNQKQFHQLVGWGIEQSQGMLVEQQKEHDNTQKTLRSEWGFRYNDNVEKAHQTLAMLVGYKEDHPFIKYLDNSKLGDSPEFLKFLLELGERFGEDKLINTKGGEKELAVNDAKKRINEIRADTKHPYWLENDPRHNDALKEMNTLYEKVYGEAG